MTFDIEMIKEVYEILPKKIRKSKELLDKPLTLAEKILYSHLTDSIEDFKRGESYVNFQPDRVIMQDVTAQMALLQFMQSGKEKVSLPSSVHCDHLIQADAGAEPDLQKAKYDNKEVYDFLESASKKYCIGFWKPGAGIIHQVALENYAFPGGLMIGTDSHTVNAGGLGMVAIGVGGADAAEVMAGLPWELRFPKLIGIRLTGGLNGWASAKDVILKVAGILTVKGATNAIIEYFGEGAENLSCTGKATICNMGAEIGATASLFGYDSKMAEYLRATNRSEIADAANNIAESLTGDPEVYQEPQKYFDLVIEINLSELEPYINGPFTPDLAWPISGFAEAVKKNDYPRKLEVGLIGSCTNSSYEDISRAASIAKQAIDKKLRARAKFIITPGSEKVRHTTERDGQLEIFEKIGGLVLSNACGPCIGQWKRHSASEEKNSILTSFNRNFAKRNDGNPNTHAFVASPEIVTALTIAGDLCFNPLADSLTNEDGQKIKFDEPQGIELPPEGFTSEDSCYVPPDKHKNNVEVIINPGSQRLKLLKPFPAWEGTDLKGLKLLIKAKGKCTTDHISPAGIWLRYRGHLDNLCDNLLIGAVNFFNGKANLIKNQSSKKYSAVPKTAKFYKENSIGSVIVAEENYGEGSSREQAAMEPRNLGVRAVITKSFARIHETNLKKQGILALTFDEKEDYNKVQEDDTIDIIGLESFAPDKPLTAILHHPDGSIEKIKVSHTYNKNQIEWFRAGSSLNMIRRNPIN